MPPSHVLDVGVEVCQSRDLPVVGDKQGVRARGQQLLGDCPGHGQPLSVRRAPTQLVDQDLTGQTKHSMRYAGVQNGLVSREVGWFGAVP